MKLLTIKIFIVTISFLLLLFSTAGETQASVPEVRGRVVTSTGAAVVGVWVKWIDKLGDFRFAQTDINGNFDFIYFITEFPGVIPQIDSDLDGIDDTPKAYLVATPLQNLYANYEYAFSCVSNPHNFVVVPPVGASGTFSQLTGVNLNNLNPLEILSDIVFTPSVPTPTPTLIPTYTISGNLYLDANRNGIKDAEGSFGAGTGITLSGGASLTTMTDASGNYNFSGLYAGTYTVTLTIPAGYKSTTQVSQTVTFP